jgi:hypothetical protein
MYDMAEGITKQQDLRTRLDYVSAELVQMRDLFHNLQHSSDADAMMLYMRLRAGEDVTHLLGAGIPISNRYVCSSRVRELEMLTIVEENQDMDMRTNLIYGHKLR